MPIPFQIVNGAGSKPDAAKFMANYHWIYAMSVGTFILGGGFETWSVGTALSNPADGDDLSDGFTLEKGGTSPATADFNREQNVVDTGAYAGRFNILAGGSSNSYLRAVQSVTNPQNFRGQTVVFGAKIQASSAGKVRLSVTDGVVTQYSEYHNGDGSYQTLTVPITVDAAAAVLTVKIEVTSDITGLIYMDSAFLYLADSTIPLVARQALEYIAPEERGVTLAGLLVLSATATFPSAPVQGMIFFNTADAQFYGWNGTNWAVLG